MKTCLFLALFRKAIMRFVFLIIFLIVPTTASSKSLFDLLSPKPKETIQQKKERLLQKNYNDCLLLSGDQEKINNKDYKTLFRFDEKQRGVLILVEKHRLHKVFEDRSLSCTDQFTNCYTTLGDGKYLASEFLTHIYREQKKNPESEKIKEMSLNCASVFRSLFNDNQTYSRVLDLYYPKGSADTTIKSNSSGTVK